MNSTLEFSVTCPVHDSFRVAQIAGMFDVPLSQKSTETFRIDMPPLDEDWQIGLIVGPSGSGKSTVAKKLFGDHLYSCGNWGSAKAIVDCFGDGSIKEITHLLTNVGFSSPPSWVKPYSVLSNGERFRCDLAKALFETMKTETKTIVFDEFTSVVDRNVAKIGSAAISKGIKSGKTPCRFIAVTCHYDVTDWLEPDWILDMATGNVTRRRLRRPEIKLEIYRTEREIWKVFARHHYLNGSLASGVRCYVALWKNVPVAFCAVISLMGFKGRWRISRIVTLPDYQGVGIGSAFLNGIAELYREQNERISITASHPSIISHCKRSPNWQAVNVMKTGSNAKTGRFGKTYKGSSGRAVVSFEYVGNKKR